MSHEEHQAEVEPAELRFTGQPAIPDGRIDFNLSHPTGHLDNEISETLADALKALAKVLGGARVTMTSELSETECAVREALIGFGILAFNELRAFLIVAGAGLDRHARIHFRSITEYEFRVNRIIEDPARATAFLDAFAHELKKVAEELEVLDDSAIESEIKRVLGRVPFSSARSEKKALFGPAGQVKAAMLDLPDGARKYAGTFGWPSQVSHGSVLALRDIARSTRGVGKEFLDTAARDGNGDRLGYNLIWYCLWFSITISKRFFNAVLDEVEPIARRTMGINNRLQIVSPETEQRARQLAELRRHQRESYR